MEIFSLYFLHFQKFRVHCKVLVTQRTLLQVEGLALGPVGQHLQALALLQVRREESLIGFDRLCWQCFFSILFPINCNS